MYGATLGRYQISNAWSGPTDDGAVHLLRGVHKEIDPANWGVSQYELKGAFRQVGMVKGATQFVGTSFGTDPLVMNNVPILQNHTQLFIKGSLGIPGLVQGPRGAQDILRRCVITAPQLALNYDAAATHYDNIRIAPGTYSTMRFKLEG